MTRTDQQHLTSEIGTAVGSPVRLAGGAGPAQPDQDTQMRSVTLEQIVARWSKAASAPSFSRGKIIDPNTGFRSPQGDILHLAGLNDDDILRMATETVDHWVAQILGIPVPLSILLRIVSDIIPRPQQIFQDCSPFTGTGDVVKFWWWLHRSGGAHSILSGIENIPGYPPYIDPLAPAKAVAGDRVATDVYHATRMGADRHDRPAAFAAAMAALEIITYRPKRPVTWLPLFGLDQPANIPAAASRAA